MMTRLERSLMAKAPRAMAVLFALAFLPRIILPFIGFDGQVSDTTTYLTMARGLVSGAGMVDEQGALTAFRAPSYPLFLAGMLVLSFGRLMGVQILQAFLHALIAPLLYERLLSRLGARRAFLAGLVFALDPVSIPSPAFILTEAIGACLLVLFAGAWSRIETSDRASSHAWAGLLGGTLLFQTMITMALQPAAMAWRLVRRPRSWEKILLASLIFVLPMAAWTMRNREVLGEGTAVRSGGFGFLLWASMNYDFPWLLSPYDERGNYIFIQEQRVARHLEAGEAHGVYLAKALARMRAEPIACAARIVKGAFWSWVEVPGAMKSMDRMPAVKWTLRAANILLLILAIAGIPGALRHRDGRIALAIIAYFALLHAPLYPIPRYYLPVRAFLAVLVASVRLRNCGSLNTRVAST